MGLHQRIYSGRTMWAMLFNVQLELWMGGARCGMRVQRSFEMSMCRRCWWSMNGKPIKEPEIVGAEVGGESRVI